MWEIYEHRRLPGVLEDLPLEVLKRYEKWKDIARLSGPKGLGLIRGFRDEALRGKWRGHRSSRLGLQYRIIYKVEGTDILVVQINAHDYRRR